MIGAIEGLRRLARMSGMLTAAPMMLLIIGDPAHRDPITKRSGVKGTGGVLPIPSATSSRLMHLDSLLSGHHDPRTQRGRVLYAPGHAPRDTAAAPHRRPCPAQRVVAQVRSATEPAT